MMMMVLVVWLTDERHLVLFPAGTTVTDLTIANLWQAASKVWTCTGIKFRLSWMKLCSSDNHYPTAPQFIPLNSRRTHVFRTLQWCLFWPSLLLMALNLARNEAWVVPETCLCDGVLGCFQIWRSFDFELF